MPRRDQSGPLGKGPMTGRGLGLCSGERRLLRRNRTYASDLGHRAFGSKIDLEEQRRILQDRIQEIDRQLNR